MEALRDNPFIIIAVLIMSTSINHRHETKGEALYYLVDDVLLLLLLLRKVFARNIN